MDFAAYENREGVRMSFNAWPCSRIEATRIVLPTGALVTPGKTIPEMPVLPYEPVVCEGCQGVLNPHCMVDYARKSWRCCLCDCMNNLPRNYHEINPQNLPAELFPTYTTVEYTMTNKNVKAPCFMIVLDTACPREELQDAKDSIGQLLALLPEECYVGLITFGATVTVHELSGTSPLPRSYVLRGTKDVTQEKVKKLLGLELTAQEYATYDKNTGSQVANELSAKSRFLLPVSECEFVLSNILEDLQPDCFPREKGQRPYRATGAAIAVASGVLAEAHSAQGARVMVFTTGPCTVGPGTIVGRDAEEDLRSHRDLDKNSAKHFKDATKFYNSMGIRLATSSHALDVFACSLDQVGLAEMKLAVDQTGGQVILAEQFGAENFRKSLRKMFARREDGTLEMLFNGTFSAFCTPHVMVQGCIGPVSALAVKSKSISENEVGLGQTTSWRMCAFTPSTSIAVYYEIVNQHSNPLPHGQPFYLQFCCRYKLSTGDIRLRCTTVARRWVESSAAPEIIGGFDQEACAVLMARVATFRTENEEAFDLLRWLDRTLIRAGTKFGEYRKDEPETFRLPPNIAIYPQFMFNLRRSPFLQTANNSPDETAFYRLALGRESVLNCLLMIQPTLTMYSMSGPPQPTMLDVTSITPDTILLLDGYFFVVVHSGTTIAQWRKANYQDLPDYAHFKQLLAQPVGDAHQLAESRCPTPRLVECDQGGSQARFLLAKLNPSNTHQTQHQSGWEQQQNFGGGEIIFTDDISLSVFMQHLAKLAVAS